MKYTVSALFTMFSHSSFTMKAKHLWNMSLVDLDLEHEFDPL